MVDNVKNRFIFLGKDIIRIALENIVWILLVVISFGLGIFNPAFLSPSVLMNILEQASVLGSLALAMTFVLLIGEIDLSIVGVLGFSAIIGTSMMTYEGAGGFNAFVAIMVIGFCIGVINGYLINQFRIYSLIETMAMMLVLQGLMLGITKGRSISGFTGGYRWIALQDIWGFPLLPIVLILLFIFVAILLNRTPFGRSLYAVGGNADAAFVAGINVKNIRMKAFVCSSMLAAFAGYILSARMGAVTSKIGAEFLLYSIAAPIIGGVSMFGGKGKILGVLAGVLLLSVIRTGLQISGIPAFWINFAGGLIILFAVIIDSMRHKIEMID